MTDVATSPTGTKPSVLGGFFNTLPLPSFGGVSVPGSDNRPISPTPEEKAILILAAARSRKEAEEEGAVMARADAVAAAMAAATASRPSSPRIATATPDAAAQAKVDSILANIGVIRSGDEKKDILSDPLSQETVAAFEAPPSPGRNGGGGEGLSPHPTTPVYNTASPLFEAASQGVVSPAYSIGAVSLVRGDASVAPSITVPFFKPPITITVDTASAGSDADPVMAEVDYDHNATDLYKYIEGRQWTEAARFIEDNSENGRAERASATWVIRKEKNGKLRWRLLPLHGAIMFGAPINVVEMLLETFPHGARCKDDQGMLPLHLAFRNDASDEIVTEIANAYPQAIGVKDRKGRLPLACALSDRAKTNKPRANMLQAYAYLSVALERESSLAAAEKGWRRRIDDLQSRQVEDIDRVKKSFESSLVNNIEKVNILEAENADMRVLLEDKSQSESDLTEKVRAMTLSLQTLTNTKKAETEKYEEELASHVDSHTILMTKLEAITKEKKDSESVAEQMNQHRSQDAVQKDILRSSLDDLINSHREIITERDGLRATNDSLTSLLERAAADQDGMHAILSKLEQDMGQCAAVREAMLSALAKHELDSAMTAEREHDVMRGLLDRQRTDLDNAIHDWNNDGMDTVDAEGLTMDGDDNNPVQRVPVERVTSNDATILVAPQNSAPKIVAPKNIYVNKNIPPAPLSPGPPMPEDNYTYQPRIASPRGSLVRSPRSGGNSYYSANSSYQRSTYRQ